MVEGNELYLSAPWNTFANELIKLFEKDPEVRVDYDDRQHLVKIFVESQEKAAALTDILPTEKDFGGTVLTIEVVPANPEEKSLLDKYRIAFKGNPIVSYIEEFDAPGAKLGYIVFVPKVAQFFNDDISDPLGLCSELYEDVAQHVFEGEYNGIFFTTDLDL